jgi:23S rRNA (uracil1939-C5)-methyltransferase
VRTGTAEDVREGDLLVVTIKRIGINGEGVGYYKRKAVFVPGALPEEVVKAKAVRVMPTYISAELVQIEKTSRHRKKPECPVYDTCGGCQLQHMDYEGQLAAKEELVREAFHRYVGDDPIPLRPILGMDEPWGYRNKAQLQVGYAQGKLITGLYSAGTHRLVDISGCPIQHPVINEVVRKVADIAASLNIPVYREKTRKGLLRTIVARVARHTGEVQLTLITAAPGLPDKDRLIARIREELPMVKTIAQNVNRSSSPLVFGEETTVLWGREHIREALGGLPFDLSPRSFFQLNPEQTVKLYEAVAEAADLQGDELVVDAYCGTGTIALWLAPHAAEVRGIETVAEAVADARRNAEIAGFSNVRFFAGRAENLLPQWVAQGIRPDVVVADPPRTGCDAALLKAIIRSRPRRMVYVSCNPATLAKDCKILLDGGFRLEWVQPVDMFPQTAHVECIVSTHFTG